MTRLGVLGWPVAHSRSPAMQRAALAELGLHDWTYQALPVPPELFEETVRGLAGAGFAGANVTIPHKTAALALADSASDAARQIGAANTLSFLGGGEIAAENTDAPGLLDALPLDPGGRRALVLGAGGAARAVVWALREAGAEVSVWNRTAERAHELARDLGVAAVGGAVEADILVNCTAVGLGRPDPGETFKLLPVGADQISAYACVVDLAYGDGTTALLSTAEAAGAAIVDGIEVLVRQGARSLQIWTGHDAPLDVMRRAARQG
jgi:shikimate dehydrogenase